MRKKLNADTKYNYYYKRYYNRDVMWRLKLLFHNIIITMFKKKKI